MNCIACGNFTVFWRQCSLSLSEWVISKKSTSFLICSDAAKNADYLIIQSFNDKKEHIDKKKHVDSEKLLAFEHQLLTWSINCLLSFWKVLYSRLGKLVSRHCLHWACFHLRNKRRLCMLKVICVEGYDYLEAHLQIELVCRAQNISYQMTWVRISGRTWRKIHLIKH